MRWAISGGAGFLGLHLARRLLADGHDVRTLDLAPVDDAELEREVEELRGDVRDASAAARLVDGADVLVHAAAALPIQASRDAIRSANVDGTGVVFAAALEAGAGRAVSDLLDRRLRDPEASPAPRGRAARRSRRLRRVEDRGRARRPPRRASRARGRRPASEDLHRPRAARRVSRSSSTGSARAAASRSSATVRTRYQLLAVEDLVEATVSAGTADVAGETFNVGATAFGTVRSDLEGLIGHAGSASRLRPVPARPAELALRALELARLSPLAEWHYRTAHRDSFVDVSKAQRLLGYRPRLSNEQALARPTTGTSRIATGSARRASRTACRGTSGPWAC